MSFAVNSRCGYEIECSGLEDGTDIHPPGAIIETAYFRTISSQPIGQWSESSEPYRSSSANILQSVNSVPSTVNENSGIDAVTIKVDYATEAK